MIPLVNMRVEVSITSVDAVLEAGGCVSYLTTPSPVSVYAEGKPDHIKALMKNPKIYVMGEPENVPRTKYIDLPEP